MSAREHCRDLGRRFAEAGVATPDLDARLLTCVATGLSAAQLLAADAALTPVQHHRLEEWASRRLRHESIARIIGRREFWKLDLALSDATLEPRPDSETLIEAALHILRGCEQEDLSFLDLGTGSGALLLALLQEFPCAQGIGVDKSEQALATARQNAIANNLDSRTNFICGDWMDGLTGRFDLIVANPPYIPSAECAKLSDEVRLYDPRLALDGGEDGLSAYRAIAANVREHLDQNGFLIVEIGCGQINTVAEILQSTGLHYIGARADLAGIERALIVQNV